MYIMSFGKMIGGKMIGGKMIGEGGFGCVYYPSINCDGTQEQTKQYISKIQKYNSTAKTEIQIGDIVRTIPSYSNFFAPIIQHCKQMGLSKFSSSIVDTCDIFKKKTENKYIIMKSEYVDKYDLFEYIIKSDNNKHLILNILSTYTHLLIAIKKLVSKNIVHYDLKGGNIMFSTFLNVPKIIDFGLSINMDNVTVKNMKEYFYIYASDYYIWAPEIQYLSYIANNHLNPSKNEIREIAESIVKNNVSLHNLYSASFIKKYKDTLIKFLLKFSGKTPQNVLETMRKYYNTWDNYSISILFMKIIHYLNMNGFSDNKFIIFFSQLLLQNIHPDPDRRLSIQHTITLFNDYFYGQDMNAERDYSEMLVSLQKNKDVIITQIHTDEKHLESARSSNMID